MSLPETATTKDPFRSFPTQLSNLLRKKKYAQSLAELQLLAEQGSVEAAIMMAHIHFHGGGGIRRNYVAARHWLEIIDKDGSTFYSAYRLGIIYYKGLGVVPDHAVAYRHFRRSGLKGNLKSLIMVGGMQRDGEGVCKKPKSSKVILFRCAQDRRLDLANRSVALAIALGL